MLLKPLRPSEKERVFAEVVLSGNGVLDLLQGEYTNPPWGNNRWTWRSLDQIKEALVRVTFDEEIGADPRGVNKALEMAMERPAEDAFEMVEVPLPGQRARARNFNDMLPGPETYQVAFCLNDILGLLRSNGLLDEAKIGGTPRYLLRFRGETDEAYGERKAIEKALWRSKETVEGQAMIVARGPGGWMDWLSPDYQGLHPDDLKEVLDAYEVETRVELPEGTMVAIWKDLGLINRQNKVPARIARKFSEVALGGKPSDYTPAFLWLLERANDPDLLHINSELEELDRRREELLSQKTKRERELF